MIAGNDADAIRGSQGGEPSERVGVLLRQTDVGEITRHHDVIGCLRLHVGHQTIGDAAQIVRAAPAPPIPIASQPLQVPIAWRKASDRAKVHVGEVGDGERHGHRCCGLVARSASLAKSAGPVEEEGRNCDD